MGLGNREVRFKDPISKNIDEMHIFWIKCTKYLEEMIFVVYLQRRKESFLLQIYQFPLPPKWKFFKGYKEWMDLLHPFFFVLILSRYGR